MMRTLRYRIASTVHKARDRPCQTGLTDVLFVLRVPYGLSLGKPPPREVKEEPSPIILGPIIFSPRCLDPSCTTEV